MGNWFALKILHENIRISIFLRWISFGKFLVFFIRWRRSWWRNQIEIFFRVTGPMCGKFTGDRWISRTKASDAELWCFLWSTPKKRLNKQSRCWWFETPSCSLWRNSNVIHFLSLSWFCAWQMTVMICMLPKYFPLCAWWSISPT